jgi:hypothetical protein
MSKSMSSIKKKRFSGCSWKEKVYAFIKTFSHVPYRMEIKALKMP